MKEEQNLMDGILNEIERVNHVITYYEDSELKGAGMFIASLMKKNIANAKSAISSGDVVAMIREYQNLKEWSV